jgi:hypothetical protein
VVSEAVSAYVAAVGAGIALRLDLDGRLVVDATVLGPRYPVEAVWRHHVAISLMLHGQRTGHRWAECDSCGAGQLIAGTKRRCVLTPRCRGHVRTSYQWTRAGRLKLTGGE